MITHYDFVTGQIIETGKATIDFRLPVITRGATHLRLLTVDEARANEQLPQHHRFDHIIVESLIRRPGC
jgi:hypothetical protein